MAWQTLGAAVALLTAGAAAQAPAPPAPAPLPASAAEFEALSKAEVLFLETERYRRLTVPVTIDGQGPFRFMIDTGAQATVLSRTLADKLELHDRKSATLVGMASSRPIETTAVENVTLGSRTFYIRSAPVVETGHIGDADGILGLDSLQDQRVLLDFEKKRIIVADAEDLGGNRGYEIVVRARDKLGQLIITHARLDGVRVAVIVDSGASGSIGNPALLDRLRRLRRGTTAQLTDINGVTLNGPVRVAGELRVGSAIVQNIPVLFADSPPFHRLGLADEPALILGMAELKLFRRVAIDFKTRRVLFDLPPNADLGSAAFAGF